MKYLLSITLFSFLFSLTIYAQQTTTKLEGNYMNSSNKEYSQNNDEFTILKRVYIAGPYSKGDVAVNVRNAFKAANDLADLGFAPFVPHATHFWHMLFPRPYEFWLKLDSQFLLCCDALLRLPGESSGADKEVKLAEKKGIPVFHDIDSLVKFFNTKK